MDAVSFTLFSPRYLTSKSIYIPRGVLWISSDGDNRMGAKIKTQYMTLCAILYLQNCTAGIRGHYHKSSDCFEYRQKIPTLIKPPQKSTCQIFLPHKNPGIKNFEPTKILWSSPCFEIWSALHGYIYNSASCRKSN